MNIEQDDRLTNEEKNLVAMGAAMGAGCRTCADKLYALALSLNIPEAMMVTALPPPNTGSGPLPRVRQRLSSSFRYRWAEESRTKTGKMSAFARLRLEQPESFNTGLRRAEFSIIQ